MSKFTMVYYYVPEDKDDPDYPNAFGINLAQEDIKLKDVRNAFPLEGEYHFRFKYKVNNQVVWMDLPSENSGLPLFSAKIFIKATRISWESKQNQQGFSDDTKMRTSGKISEDSRRETTPTNSNNQNYSRPQQQAQPQPQQSQNDYNLLDGTSYGTTQSSNNNPYGGGNSKNESHDLYDIGYDDNKNQQPKQQNNDFGFDLL